MNDNNPFPEMRPEQRIFPIFIRDIWKIILKKLSRRDMLLARHWSKSFRELLRDPLTDDLRQLSKDLGYDIDPQQLNFASFYIRSDKQTTTEEKTNVIQLLKKVLVDETNMDLVRGTFYDIRAYDSEKEKELIQYHPLMISTFIEIFYCFALSEYSEEFQEKWVQNRITAYKSLTTLTPEQKARVRVVEAFNVMKDKTLTHETRKPKLEEIFGIKIAAGKFPGEEFTQILLGFNVRSYNMSECLKLALQYYQGISDRIIVPVSKSHLFVSPSSAYPTFVIKTKRFLFSVLQNAIKQRGLQDPPWEHNTDKKKIRISRRRNPILHEAFLRASFMEKPIDENSFVKQFMAYYAQPVMQQILAFDPPLEFTPRWLRSYLFTPELFTQEEDIYLEQWDLSKVPRFFFKKDFSLGRIRESELLRLFFELFELGIEFVDKVLFLTLLSANHSNDTLCTVRDARNTSLGYHDVLDLLKNIGGQTLTRFIDSQLFNEITDIGINNLYFWRWMASNQVFLNEVLRAQPEFFRTTVQQLFSLCPPILVENDSISNLIISSRYPQIFTMTYFELIRQSFENHDRLLSNLLCENLFTQGEKESLLVRVMKANPLYLLMRFSFDLKPFRADPKVFETNFIEMPFNHPDPLHIYRPQVKKGEKSKHNKKPYNLLAQPTHLKLLLKMLSCPELISNNTICKNTDCFRSLNYWRLPEHRFNKKFYLLVMRFANLKILDQPDRCCAYITHFGVDHLLSKKPIPADVDLPVEDNDDLVISQDDICEDLKWLLQPSHRTLLKKFVFENISPAAKVLSLFAESNLADKPDYCCLLLEHYGVERLLTFPSLDIFSKASSREALSDTVKDIRVKARDFNLSEKDYMNKYRAQIEKRLAPEPASAEPVVKKQRSKSPSFWPSAEPVTAESEPKKQKTDPEDQLSEILSLFHPS